MFDLGEFPIRITSAKVRRIPLEFAKRGDFLCVLATGSFVAADPAGCNLRLLVRPMKRGSKNSTGKSSLPEGCPEFAVSRDTIRSFFHPEISTCTFHDLVKAGMIPPFDEDPMVSIGRFREKSLAEERWNRFLKVSR